MDQLQQPIISIVDDNESVRNALGKLLRLHGYVAYSFASAEDFLQSDRLNKTSCLITDVRMPGMTGIELLEHLVCHGWQIPVIFITAFAEERSRARAMKAGAICFLNKPFDPQGLVDCIDTVVRGSNAESADDRPN